MDCAIDPSDLAERGEVPELDETKASSIPDSQPSLPELNAEPGQ